MLCVTKATAYDTYPLIEEQAKFSVQVLLRQSRQQRDLPLNSRQRDLPQNHLATYLTTLVGAQNA
jgi:hypothetical protein